MWQQTGNVGGGEKGGAIFSCYYYFKLPVGSKHAPRSDIGNDRGNAKGTTKPLYATSHDRVARNVLFEKEGIFTNLFLIFDLEPPNRFVLVDCDPLYDGLRKISYF